MRHTFHSVSLTSFLQKLSNFFVYGKSKSVFTSVVPLRFLPWSSPGGSPGGRGVLAAIIAPMPAAAPAAPKQAFPEDVFRQKQMAHFPRSVTFQDLDFWICHFCFVLVVERRFLLQTKHHTLHFLLQRKDVSQIIGMKATSEFVDYRSLLYCRSSSEYITSFICLIQGVFRGF